MARITQPVPRRARSTVSASVLRKTTRRKSSAMALYMWMTAWCAPTSDWAVRSMRSSRAWVSTEMVTSSGMASSSMSERTKSHSVCEADGKPTSISL